jgi:hypothetical protein
MAPPLLGTVDQLIESCSRRGNIPNSQMTYLTPDFLAIAQEELEAYAIPLVQSRREDYYLEEIIFDYATPDRLVGLPGGLGSRDLAWRLPPWAMASAIREVQGVSPSGAFYTIGRINVDDIPDSVTQGWYFYGAYIVLHYSQTASTSPPISLRVVYHVLPNNLTTTAQDTVYGLPNQIETITTDPIVFQMTKRALFTGYMPVDFIRGTPGFEVYQRNINVTFAAGSLNATPGPFPVGSDQSFQVGDWLAQPGTTPVVPLPHELHALLAQRMVVKFLEAQGDQEQLEQSRKSLGEMAIQIPMLINPRAEGKPRKLANRLSLWRRWRW